jgi:membrane fusion protein, multidrug efflux system
VTLSLAAPTYWRIPLLAIVGATVAGLSACQPQAGSPGSFPTPEVAVVVTEPETVPVTFEYTAQTAGSREVEVRARVTGILQKRNYREGVAVRAGQSLFTIDPAPFQAAASRAEAEVVAAEARLAQASRDEARLRPLREARAVSQKEYDDAASARDIAAADLKSNKARLTEARLNLGYTKVEAPITGIASRALRSEGSLISGPDVLLTTVTQVDPIYVNFGIPGADQLRLQQDLQAGRLVLPKDGKFEVTVKLADGSAYRKSGKLDFTDVRVSTETGTSDARAELPNPDAWLKPGQFVRVQLEGAARLNAILVPQRAVLEGPKGKYVYIVTPDSKAESRPVEVGDWTGDAWVINTGLAAGDRVIVDGVMKIGPGAPVKVADPPAAPAAQLKQNDAARPGGS